MVKLMSESINLEQFEIDDTRSTSSFVSVMRERGYEPVFKDWDRSFLKE